MGIFLLIWYKFYSVNIFVFKLLILIYRIRVNNVNVIYYKENFKLWFKNNYVGGNNVLF